MDYFRISELDEFIKDEGKKYRATSEGTKWYKDSRNKLNHLAKLLSNELDINLYNNYKEKPNGQAGRGKGFVLKSYVLNGFVPSKYKNTVGKDVFLKFQFHIEDNNLYFVIDCDTNYKNENNVYNKIRKELNKKTFKQWLVNDDFPKNYSELASLIKPMVKKNIDILERYILKSQNKTSDSSKSDNSLNIPLNQILYGPPGTGKTYSTVDKVVEICSPENYFHNNHLKNKETYDQLIEDGNVFFTTFHQSLGYEDFIEGIKPVAPKKETDNITYEVEDGIFKSICEQCLDEIREIKAQKDESIQEGMSFKEKYDEFVKRIQNGLIIVKTRNGLKAKVSRVSASGNMRLKTGNDTNDYIISVGRLKKLVEELPKPKSITNIHKKVKSIIGGSHTSLYYAALESFVEFEKVLQKEIKEEGKEVKLKDVSLSKQEIEDLPKYALIIDEINRGNVSAIFGELITLLEEDKRFGHQNQIFAKLPYSKSNFIVPPNLYIIGTMNTADRSVEALDTALRRRFSFVEMMPDSTLLGDTEVEGIKLAELLTTINDRIEVLIDRDHTIGHSYFMNVKDMDGLRFTFKNKIIPLLQEYFYGDYQKMEMVIGSLFFNFDKKNKKVEFAVKNYELDEPRKCYEISNVLDESFDMKQAIESLLNPSKSISTTV